MATFLKISENTQRPEIPLNNILIGKNTQKLINLLVGGLLEVAVFGHLLKKMEFLMLFPF